jgi:hypothetical protein
MAASLLLVAYVVLAALISPLTTPRSGHRE